VANARKFANVVIIVPHWGVEYTADPSPRQREFARAAAAAGADMIVGNHPHWVQAHEKIGGMFVAYALGNFVFDQDWSLETAGRPARAAFTGSRSRRRSTSRSTSTTGTSPPRSPEERADPDRIEQTSR
jgi:poly-gamma-glutamate synthesis protein (capsule biosynthesis protein)